MLQFHPPDIGQEVIDTSLGLLSFYTPVGDLWPLPSAHAQPLLFLHSFGGGASAYEWSKVYPAFLSSDYRVIAPDLIGWGQSAHPVRDYSVEDYLTTLTELIEATCDRPVDIVAASLTGAISIRLAIQRPELVRSLFLISPSGFRDFGEDAGRRLPLQLINTPLLDELIYSLGAMNELAVRNFLEQFLFADPGHVSQEMVNAYLESATQPNARYAALAFLRGNLYFNLANYIQQLTTPTAILWGEQAQFTAADLGQRLAKLNPQTVKLFIRLEEVGVLPHLEQPALVIAWLQQFLNGLNREDLGVNQLQAN